MNTRYNFNQGWEFAYAVSPDLQIENTEEMEKLVWEAVTLPHSLRLEPVYNLNTHTYQGVCLYRKTFSAKELLDGKKVFLEFEAVMGVTDAWLNGHHLQTAFGWEAPDQDGTVHTNCGGYLPFVLALHPYLNQEKENVLLLRVDNRDDGQVPPGKPQELLDFTYFGGIYRDAWLKTCDSLYITDPLYENLTAGGGVFVHTEAVSQEKAVLRIETQIRNEASERAEFTLRTTLEMPHGAVNEIADKRTDAQGNRTAAQSTKKCSLAAGADAVETIELEIKNPLLWSLEKPQLYTVVSELLVHGETVYIQKQHIGIREILADRKNGLRINGIRQPLLSGVNRHQDFPIIGNAAAASLQRRDAVLYKEAGFSVVRAAHYPMSEEFLNACDELGILLIEATPGWQWYPVGNDEPFTTRVHQNIRQMIRRDRNHPCILSYEVVLNETYHVPYGYTRRLEEIALEEDPHAKISAESYGYDASPEANGIDKLADFIYGFEQPLEKTEKAVMFLREYADLWLEAYGDFQSRRVTRGKTGCSYPGGEARNVLKARKTLWEKSEDGYTLLDCQEMYNENPAFTGCAIWTGIDSRGAKSEISACGVWDTWRLPKYACYAYKSQQEPKQEGDYQLFTASRWTAHAPVIDQGEGSLGTDDYREIDVYSNCAEVELAVVKGEEVLFSKKQQPVDCALAHPPFCFRKVPYTPGTKLAVKGYDKNGILAAQQFVLPEETPERIELEVSTLGVPVRGDGSDMVFVYARVVDRNGTVCEDYEGEIHFTAEGGEIIGTGNSRIGANPAAVEAGIAAAYLRPQNGACEITLKASVPGLSEASVLVKAEAAAEKQFPYHKPQAEVRCVSFNNLGEEEDICEDSDAEPTRVNLACGEHVTATASINSESAQAVILQAGRFWENMWMGTPLQNEEPQWWQVDLGALYDVRNAQIHIGGQMGSDCTNYTYEIQTSPDGENWTTQTSAKRTGWSNGVLDYFQAQDVRYLRIVFTHIDGILSAALSKVEIYEDSESLK